MVRRRTLGNSGKSKIGCLLMLLLVAGSVYYGIDVGKVYVRYWRMKDKMQTEARLAPIIDNATIRRRLVRKAEELGLPKEANDFTIRRTTRPREIRITTSWTDTLDLPFYRYPVTFKPVTKAQL